jgi:hypothetical protein
VLILFKALILFEALILFKALILFEAIRLPKPKMPRMIILMRMGDGLLLWGMNYF